MTGAAKRPRTGEQPEHPDEAGGEQFFWVRFGNTNEMSRAKGDPWKIIPVAIAHNLRDGDEGHRNKHPSDPARKHLNEARRGGLVAADVVKFAHDTLKSASNPPRRHDAVMEWEFMVSPPTGWDRPDYWRVVDDFFAVDEGVAGMPVVSAIIHRDQLSPHMHAVVVPVRDGRFVSRTKLNPMAMRGRFFRFMRERLGIRVDTPKKRREHRQDKRAKTLGDLAATTGAGPKTAAGARARDDALASLIDRTTGELKRVGVPLFGLADAGVPWALPRVQDAGGIQVGGIQVQGHGAGVFGGGIQVGGIQVEWVGGATCMPPTRTCAAFLPCSATQKSLPFRWLESVSASRVSEGAATGCEGLAKPHATDRCEVDPETGELLPVDTMVTAPDTSDSAAADTQVPAADDARRVAYQHTHRAGTAEARAAKLLRNYPRPPRPTFAADPARLRGIDEQDGEDAKTVKAFEFALYDKAADAKRQETGRSPTQAERGFATYAARMAADDLGRGMNVEWPRLTADLALDGMELCRPQGKRHLAQGATPSATPTTAGPRSILARRRSSIETSQRAS